MKRRNPPENCLRCSYSYCDAYGDLQCCRVLMLDIETKSLICTAHKPKQNTCFNCKHGLKENDKVFCTHKNNKLEVLDYECCKDHTNFDVERSE